LGKKRNKNTRELALRILHDIEVKDTFADQPILSFSKSYHLSSLDRRFLSELVHGITKMKRRLDHILGLFLERKMEELTPWIKNILRMGIYQLDFLDKVPDNAAVDESVKLAKIFGHKGMVALVNAVLRRYLRERNLVSFPAWEEDKIKNIGLFYSFPDWMVQMWLEVFGEEGTIKLCQAFNRKPKLWCRINSLKIDMRGLEEIFTRENIKFRPSSHMKGFYAIESRVDLGRFLPWQKGLVYIQDESAGLPVVLLDPQPGERILDLCAAPGGKSTLIAQRMNDHGLVLAVDISEKKLEMVKENCEKLGVESATLCCADAKNFSCRPMDRILVDAPCSALGTLGRHSDARWRKRSSDLLRLQELQLEILLNASGLVRKGGVLVYSTCTITAEENQQVVERFLQKRKDFKVTDASVFVNPELVDQHGLIRTLPHLHNMDGSFACRFERIQYRSQKDI
jgi:16S rRNA (cytosine967-C5)-methyltransferase